MKKANPVKSVISLVVLYCLVLNLGSQMALSATKTGVITPSPSPTPTPTATPVPTPIDPELQKLKDRTAFLEEQKKQLEIEKGINDLKFPKPTTTPLAGNTELDAGVKIESEMMAYRALKNVADKVSEEVEENRNGATTLAILNNQWLMGIKSYWATNNQMKLMQDGYDSILVPPRLPILFAKQTETGLMAKILGKESSQALTKVDKKSVDEFSKLDDVNRVTADDVSTNAESEAGGGLSSGLSAGLSLLGTAGSIVGAFIDVAALMRTDTKITGSSFAVQESSLVSEVYRGLKGSGYTNLYYPAEFSPNINIRSDFVILKDIQTLYETKSRAEQLITEIEEVEKPYKEALVVKENLEARGKQLPDLIAAAERELKKNKDIYKTPKFRSAELLAKIKDGENTVADLKKELNVDLPKKIANNKKAITVLDVRLTRLYEQIRTVKPEIDLIRAYSVVAESLDEVSYRLLKRTYTLEELEKLLSGDKETKDRLIKEANAKVKLSEEDKDRLLNPIESERLRIFLKVANHIENNSDLFIQPVLNTLLSDEEQLMLFYPLDEQVTVAKKILDRSKASSLSKLKALNKQFDKFFEDIIKVDATVGVNAITSHLQTENLLNALGCDMVTGKCDAANALVLKVVDVGGNNKVKKNLITMIATGDDVSHSGGAIIEYKMYNLYGNVLTSSVCSAYERYRKAKNIKNENVRIENNARCTPEQKSEEAGGATGDTQQGNGNKQGEGEGQSTRNKGKTRKM